jgi:type II secretory pathway pseudopilin PulG
MKPIINKFHRKAAFTIVELLTVMSIIVILIGLLVPALNKVRRYAMDVKQKAQFHSIEAAVELFISEFDTYPPSTYDPAGSGDPARSSDYCGAMKLAEAMMGTDLMGYHPDSVWRSDGLTVFRDLAGVTHTRELYNETTLGERKGPYLPLENANAYRLGDLYRDSQGNLKVGNFDSMSIVLCDVYKRVTNYNTGKRVGMPILYYTADTSKTAHIVGDPGSTIADYPSLYSGNIYNVLDNYALVNLGFPGQDTGVHQLARPARFYQNIKNEQLTIARPFRADTYILISAGFDGEYGTADDICNFDWKYVEFPD